ncbi:MAG TPA: YceI family protein [Streptosporangiaceae bacterium]|jgi:polyisoprenoid-binding protein YceI|nr:YceI family protein [Streptosporangiaceae bacterium]
MASPPAPAALGRSAGVYAPVGWAAGTWTIDPAHTALSFAVRHLMSRVRGTFTDVSGQIVTSADPTGSTATAVIAVSSVNTGNQMRDDHLRSADFFEAERYPAMTFTSRMLREVDDCWVLSGDLTIRDVTRPVHLEVEFLGTDPTGMQGETRIGFSARATISRRDFGITFGLAVDGSKIVVADTVDIVLDVQAFLGA